MWGTWNQPGCYKNAILTTLVYPFFAWFMSFMLYATYFSRHENARNGDLLSFQYIGMWVVLMIFGKMTTKFLLLTAVQMTNEGFLHFVKSMWNWVDVLLITGTSVYVLASLTGFLTSSLQTVIAAVCVLLYFIKLMFYLRTFEDYAIFIRMVLEMIAAPELMQFWLMLFFCLAGFASLVYILNFNRQGAGDEPIYEDYLDSGPLSAFIHAWFLGLGEFGMDNYSEKNSWTMYIYFVGATIIVQLVFMNILIAIMSEQYARLNETKEQNQLKEISMMMADHVWLLRPDELYIKDRYILVIGPDWGFLPESTTDKKITDLQEYVEDRVKKSDDDILKKLGTLEDKLAQVQDQQAFG